MINCFRFGNYLLKSSLSRTIYTFHFVPVGCTIILGVTIVVPICMMIIGALYLYDCPQGEYIPVYLLVGGGFGVFKQLLHLSARVRQRQEERDEERIRQSPTQTLINCFMLGWFIIGRQVYSNLRPCIVPNQFRRCCNIAVFSYHLIGSMWVYKEYEPNYDPNLGKHCNKTLYLFAFWLITSVYICLGVITAGLCSISVASIAFQRPPPDLM